MSSGWRRRSGAVVRTFSADESSALTSLASGLDETLAHAAGTRDDAVLTRLIPPAYDESEGEASDEFAGHTAVRIAEGKQSRLRVLVDDLTDERGEPARATVTLDAERGQQWMLAVNDVRLALAARLGVERLDDPALGPVGDVYLWLGWLQSGLIDAVAGFADGER